MIAPVFVAEHETSNWANATSSDSIGFTPGNGNILVSLSANENSNASANQITLSGTPTWSNVLELLGSNGSVCYEHSYSATGGGSSVTTSVTSTRGAGHFGTNILEFSGSDGIGASSKTADVGVTGTHATLSLTTTQDNSDIAFIIADFTARSTTGTFDTINGNTPSVGNGQILTAVQDGTLYTVWAGYYQDVGTAGSKTVGFTNPSSMTATIIAVEILGSSLQNVVAWLKA